MTIRFRHGAVAMLLLASVGSAAAQLAPASPSPSGGMSQSAPLIDLKAGLQLTPEQRSMIFRSVSQEKSKVKPPPASLSALVGADLPPSLELYTVPDAVTAEVPNTKLYKYTIVNDQVVLVDPSSMKVVEVIRQ